MKTIVIIECRKCGQQYCGETIEKIETNEEIGLVIKTIARCSSCSETNDRSISAKSPKRLNNG
jgi:hypothetical protein